jgi:UDP:flavonoid glycosyltransferase YjiC (YdhE family)
MRPLSFDGAPLTSPPAWTDSFGQDRPGVYVTFGTEVSQRAPWNELFEALSDHDVDVVATVGSHVDPATLDRVAPNIRVEQYVPQSFIIDRARVVVSHSGAGTVIGAATAGAVQLCVPIAADQWDNADLLAAANVGVVLEQEQRDADTISHSIERLLDDQSMHTDAQVLSDYFASMPHPSLIAAELDQFV